MEAENLKEEAIRVKTVMTQSQTTVWGTSQVPLVGATVSPGYLLVQ